MNNTFYGFTTEISGVFFLTRYRHDPNIAGNTIFTVHRMRQFGYPVHSPDITKFPPSFPFTYIRCNGIENKLDNNAVGPYFGDTHIDDIQIGVWEITAPPAGDFIP